MQGEDRKGPAEKALDAYKDAEKEAEDLPSTNPISLGLALNFSVFYYEILDSPEKACRLAKKAFDGAVGDLEKSSESQFKESALILQLLRDNLTLWTSEMQEDGKDSYDHHRRRRHKTTSPTRTRTSPENMLSLYIVLLI